MNINEARKLAGLAPIQEGFDDLPEGGYKRGLASLKKVKESTEPSIADQLNEVLAKFGADLLTDAQVEALSEAKVKAIKLTVPDVTGMKGKKLQDAIFGEDEGDDSFIQNQTAVTVEYINLKGNTLYVYPMADLMSNDSRLDSIQKKLQVGLDKWAAKMNKKIK